MRADREATRYFTSFDARGTHVGVVTSYLGIITPHGLERFVAETEHAALFLLRRIAREPWGELVVCWAVLDESAARIVAGHVARHQFHEALQQLDDHAVHLGTIVPSADDGSACRHAS